MPQNGIPYRGRFAPSPTGPLHLGSLIAALASYLDARHHGGLWLMRMEDLDPPREEPGAAQCILHSLRCHGLDWDGQVMWQGQRLHAYGRARARLADAGHLFRCACTRASLGPDGACGGRCAARQGTLAEPTAARVRVPEGWYIEFEDLIQGMQASDLGREMPDFVIRRKDGLDAYQLAVVVDDAEQGVTHVVRGSDLLDSTPRQVCLQQLLGCPTPVYAHLPVIANDQGRKFSKQNHAPPLDDGRAVDNLLLALRFLQQPAPPAGISTVSEVLAFATPRWDVARVPAATAIPAARFGLPG